MTTEATKELIRAGLNLVDEALGHFMQAEDSEHAKILANIAHGLLVFGEMVYSTHQK